MCVTCAKPSPTGTAQCAPCAEKKKAHFRTYAAKCKADGKCISCGQPSERPGRDCNACLAKQARSANFRLQGLCVLCGGTRAPGGTRCAACIAKTKACLDCGKDRVPHDTRCADCLAKYTVANTAKVIAANAKSKSEGRCYHCRKPCDRFPKPICTSCRQKQTDARRKIKLDTFKAYGGAKCACCGEKTLEFLTLDHVNNDGGKQRKENPRLAGMTLCRTLRNQGYPPGFAVLCFNCNCAKGLYGECPHERKRRSQLRL